MRAFGATVVDGRFRSLNPLSGRAITRLGALRSRRSPCPGRAHRRGRRGRARHRSGGALEAAAGPAPDRLVALVGRAGVRRGRDGGRRRGARRVRRRGRSRGGRRDPGGRSPAGRRRSGRAPSRGRIRRAPARARPGAAGAGGRLGGLGHLRRRGGRLPGPFRRPRRRPGGLHDPRVDVHRGHPLRRRPLGAAPGAGPHARLPAHGARRDQPGLRLRSGRAHLPENHRVDDGPRRDRPRGRPPRPAFHRDARVRAPDRPDPRLVVGGDGRDRRPLRARDHSTAGPRTTSARSRP